MPSAKPPKLKPADLRAAFLKDLATCWAHAKQLHPDHTPYAFVLYGVEDIPQLTPHVLTEESLKEVGRHYVEKGYHETLDEACKALRYSVADSPLFDELAEMLPTVNALMAPHETSLGEDKGYAILAKAAMEAFVELDKQGLFGTGKKRESLLIVIITEDVEKDWSKPSAKKLNPPAVFKRFEAETKIHGKWASCQTIGISPDGRTLFAGGSRDSGDKKTGSASEIAAYDIVGPRLRRRWSFTFPQFGDSCRALACTRDGSNVLAMRARYNGDKGSTLIMRFARDSKTPLQQTEIAGEPVDFALSTDDSRMAVSTNDKSLHILDEKFNLLKVLKLESRAHNILFLASGDLLAATDNGIFRVNSDFEIKPTPFEQKAFGISTDDAEKFLVVSRFLSVYGREKDKATEFGAEVLELPSFKPLCTILVPGFQAITPSLSPDGRHLALEAHEIAARRVFIIVFETTTGREIARHKSNFNTLKFLRDNRTVAIPENGFHPAHSAPIILWTVPGL